MFAIGIDISSHKSTVAVLSSQTNIVIKPFDIPHTPDGVKHLVDKLNSLDGEIKIVMEHTGRYYEAVAISLHHLGFFVSAVKPLLIRDYNENTLRKVKTDNADAVKIARYTLSNWETLRQYTPEEEIRYLLKTMNTQYQLASKTLTAHTNNLIALAEQIPMFDEAEQESDVNPKTLQTTEVKSHKRVRRTRDEFHPDLPVEEVFHEAEEKTCDKCGSEMTVIGKEKIRDELVYVPARLFLRRHVAEVVKCTSCGMDETKDEAVWCDIEKCNIRTAEVPAPMIPHSFVSPELLVHIVYEKYCNAMPLYRLEKDFAAKGANISRTTMANWIITAAQLWVKPIWEQMHRELVTSNVIHADETVVQVLNEPGKKAKTDSRM